MKCNTGEDVHRKEVTYYVAVFHIPCFSHTSLLYPLIKDLCKKFLWDVQIPMTTRHYIFFNMQKHNQTYARNFAQ
jgi:hypothetical protein